jgi:hypothetical protein
MLQHYQNGTTLTLSVRLRRNNTHCRGHKSIGSKYEKYTETISCDNFFIHILYLGEYVSLLLIYLTSKGFISFLMFAIS